MNGKASNHPRRMLSLASLWLALIGGGALSADLWPLADPSAMALGDRRALPSISHPLGTDSFGRDLLSRVLYGGRISLAVAVFCPLLGLLVGGTLGVLAAYLGGWPERIARLFTDTLLALPALLIAMLLAVSIGGSVTTLVWTLGLLSTPVFARVARVRTRVIAQLPYVDAARSLGASHLTVLRHHVLPNVLPPLLTLCTLVAAVVVVLEGALGYLGLGVSPPTPSWGAMIAEGRASLETRPHVCLAPASAMVLTVMALNLLGDAANAPHGQARRA
ncbi:MAG: ABC transporter permease [Pseudomonadota bacterium]